MKTIFIETDFKSFEDFHDKRWFIELFKLIEGSNIVQEVERFSAHWWGASRAFALPWLFVDGVYEAVNGVVPILDKSKQELWEDYLNANAFKGALWKVAEGAYGSIYYAYENLVVDLVNKSLAEQGKSAIRVNEKQFISTLIAEFGNSLVNEIWVDNFISMSREVRNCIVHRGGRVSPRLLKMKPLPQIEGEDILISASDVRTLHINLQPKVIRLITFYCKI